MGTAIEKMIFVKDNYADQGQADIIVAHEDWFKETPACEIRNQYGIVENVCENRDKNGDCCCVKVPAYEYFDGSIMRHFVINASDSGDERYTTITDEDEVTRLRAAIESMEHVSDTTGYQNFRASDDKIVCSQWQGDFALYYIYENYYDEETETAREFYAMLDSER